MVWFKITVVNRNFGPSLNFSSLETATRVRLEHDLATTRDHKTKLSKYSNLLWLPGFKSSIFSSYRIAGNHWIAGNSSYWCLGCWTRKQKLIPCFRAMENTASHVTKRNSGSGSNICSISTIIQIKLMHAA